MPVSKKRKRNIPTKEPNDASLTRLRYSRLETKEEHHASHRESFLEMARKSVLDFPLLVEGLRDELKKSDPLGILAAIAYYGLQTTVNKDGEISKKSFLPNILQHHVEFLQGLILMLPNEYVVCDIPFTPDVIERVVDVLPKIDEGFRHQRVLAASRIDEKLNATLLSLQERIRVHTQGVRNWGYFSEVVQISSDLYGPLDEYFYRQLGFSASELISIMRAIVNESERRNNEKWNMISKVVRKSTTKKMIKAYHDLNPRFTNDAEDLLSFSALKLDREIVISLIMSHSDLSLYDQAKFTLAEIVKITGIESAVVRAALKAISLVPGSLKNDKLEQIFLGNPVWEYPGIELPDAFFLPAPQIFFSHIHRIMDRLANEAGIRARLENRRALYLEEKLTDLIRKGLPGAELTRSAKWKVGDTQFETDLLVVLDRCVFIAEAKSNRLTASGLRGAPDRVKRHVEDLIIYPSIQSARLEHLITEARKGNIEADIAVRGLGIDPTVVDQVVRFSITLDDFSVLSSAEAELKEIEWVPADHKLAPTMSIADLYCLVDILCNPLLLIHYLSERTHLQKSFNLLGDEMDFLGLYLETGFNVAGLREKDTVFSVSGVSSQLDHYYTSRDAGIVVQKPKARLRPLFAQTINNLATRRSHGWTTAGLHLLSAADPDEQKIIEKKLVQLRGMVRRDYSNPQHFSALSIRPPEDRKAQVMLYLFPEQLRLSSRSRMEDLATEALDNELTLETVVVFGRSTEVWNEPYEAIMIAKRKT